MLCYSKTFCYGRIQIHRPAAYHITTGVPTPGVTYPVHECLTSGQAVLRMLRTFPNNLSTVPKEALTRLPDLRVCAFRRLYIDRASSIC